jgi:hypothetical protein
MQSQREVGFHLIPVRAVDGRHDVQPWRRATRRLECLLLTAIVAASYAGAWLISAVPMAARRLARRVDTKGCVLKPSRRCPTDSQR